MRIPTTGVWAGPLEVDLDDPRLTPLGRALAEAGMAEVRCRSLLTCREIADTLDPQLRERRLREAEVFGIDLDIPDDVVVYCISGRNSRTEDPVDFVNRVAATKVPAGYYPYAPCDPRTGGRAVTDPAAAAADAASMLTLDQLSARHAVTADKLLTAPNLPRPDARTDGNVRDRRWRPATVAGWEPDFTARPRQTHFEPPMAAVEVTAIRKALGLSGEEFAAELAIVERTVRRWENSVVDVPAGKAHRIRSLLTEFETTAHDVAATASYGDPPIILEYPDAQTWQRALQAGYGKPLHWFQAVAARALEILGHGHLIPASWICTRCQAYIYPARTSPGYTSWLAYQASPDTASHCDGTRISHTASPAARGSIAKASTQGTSRVHSVTTESSDTA
ncbi:MAG: hypothetical protein ABI418_08690 [Jatrophihabitantaceae bacterium]